MFTKKTVVLAKIETAYGTDPIPTSVDAIAATELEIRPVGETIERNLLRGTLSPVLVCRGLKKVDLSFKTELKGTGTPGMLPAHGWEGVLFRACGMVETVNAGVDILYSPVSTDFASCTIYVYRDRLFHKLTGCRGSFRISIEAGKPAFAEWRFHGLYNSPADMSPSSPVFSTLLPPVAAGAGFTIAGFAPVAEKIEFDLNNTIAERKSLSAEDGIAGFEITARRPQGSFDPEAVLESTHPFWDNWANAPALALNLSLGTLSGNRFAIEAPALQYRDIASSDKDGRILYQVPFTLAMSSGDDEFGIRFL